MSASDVFYLKKKYLFWFVAIIALFVVFYQIRSVLLPFYIAFFAVVLFGGIVNFLEKKFRIPRAVSAGIISFIFFWFITYVLFLIMQLAITKASIPIKNINNIQYNRTIIDNFSSYINSFIKQYNIENIFNLLFGQIADTVAKYTKNFANYLIGYFSNIISILFLLALTPIVMFMMLKDMPKIKQTFYNLLPVKIQKETKKLFNEIYESVFKYLEGQTIDAFVLSFLYSLALLPIGIEHFILLGIIIGFSSFIPYIGFYSATLITLFSAYNQFHCIEKLIITFIVMIVLQILDSGFITPKIVGNKLGVNPLVVIFGVLVSVPLFGFLGVLLALPIIGVLSVICKFFVKKYKNSSYYLT